MSSAKANSNKSPTSSSKSSSKNSLSSSGSFHAVSNVKDEAYYVTPEFIYGGPFIQVKLPSPFIDTITPMNLPLQGTFRQSFAYLSLKDKLPVILTKLIDKLSKRNDADSKIVLQKVTKLKNDLMTNKEYDPFTLDTPEAKKWNEWIDNQLNKKYYTNNLAFTECYVFRRLYEGCEIAKGLQNYDYFEDEKNESLTENLLPMCMAAEKILPMMTLSEKDKQKQDLISLLKLSLWANKCDLSFSVGQQVKLSQEIKPENPPPPPPEPPKGKGKGKGKKGKGPPKPIVISLDPFQMILDLKERMAVDHSKKVADQIIARAEKMQTAIEGNVTFKQKCSCNRLAKSFGMALCGGSESGKGGVTDAKSPAATPTPAEELPKIPCPAKMTIPNHVMIDIICDNAGYELFADLCLAAFLLEQKIVQMVRFHVKKMPWFVSDATKKDFRYLIDSCIRARFNQDIPNPIPQPTGKGAPEGEPRPETINVNSHALNRLGELFNTMLSDGQFVLLDEDFWTYPHCYCDMKKLDYNMYRKLQFAICLIFKGDLNYRKLLCERNVNPYSKLEINLQGFLPAPIVAIRTVKSEIICGVAKGKVEVFKRVDLNWMRTGQWGVIQFSPKAEPRKVADRPCFDYCDQCFGVICPEHQHDM